MDSARLNRVSDQPDAQVAAKVAAPLLSRMWYLAVIVLSPLVIVGLPRDWMWPRLAFGGLLLLGTGIVMFRTYAAGFELFRLSRKRDQRPPA